MFKNKNIIIGITGGIAAYKAIGLCSYLSQQEANVIPIMTRGATKMICPTTLRGITGNEVMIEVWEEPFPKKIAHIHLADTADLIIIAPATAHFIAKHANGLADDMLSNVLLAVEKRSKILFCPAMNVHMYNHPATKRNIQLLKDYNINILEPVVGHLACGYNAEGKLPETNEIVDKALEILKSF
jgi:phosphopantothenoylcysteine decarboxylase/phosphopantothenate--cysteine ligase